MGLVVLCGVVLFGFYLGIKFCCVWRYIYGVDKDVRFDLVVYEEFKKEVIDWVEYCICLFDKVCKKRRKIIWLWIICYKILYFNNFIVDFCIILYFLFRWKWFVIYRLVYLFWKGKDICISWVKELYFMCNDEF